MNKLKQKLGLYFFIFFLSFFVSQAVYGKADLTAIVEQVHDISLSGLPFKGPLNAAVTLAIFDDYQ